jgi:ubiquinone/menaquinone biosynthesis C-methylase UbiE
MCALVKFIIFLVGFLPSVATLGGSCGDAFKDKEVKMSFADPHEVLDGYASLERHHLAKKNIRLEQLDKIPIPSNGRVLDIGVGPGLYLGHWLNSTKAKSVNFDLFDASATLLKMSMAVASKINQSDRVKIIVGDMYQDLRKMGPDTYDVIFIGNTLEYVPDPIAFIRDTVLPILKHGGVLAIRDLDCSFMSSNLADPALNAKIVHSRIQNNLQTSRNPKNYQNPFIGKHLANIMKAAVLSIISVYPYQVEFKGPMSVFQRNYLEVLHNNWYVDDQLAILSPSDIAAWKRLFSSGATGNVFDNINSIYNEAEFLVIGHKN